MSAILVIVIAYFIGGINNAYIFTRYFKKIDIRNYGSGNAGATNVLRVLGFKAAFPVFALDALKGVVAVLLGRFMAGDIGAMLAGIAAVCGHNWPVLLGFRGGKGIATSFGVVMTINPIIGIYSFIIGILTIVFTKYVSLGSLIGAISFLILNMVFWHSFGMFMFSLVLTSLAIFQHRSNIKRLLAGTESKFGQRTRVK